MNKLILSGGRSSLERYVNAAQIEVNEESVLDIINRNTNIQLSIIIKENATLILNLFDLVKDIKIDLNVTSYDNSKFVLNNAFIAEGKYELNIDTNLYGDNISNTVNIRGVNDTTGIVRIVMNGQVAGETKNNTLNEYAKIINKSDSTNVLIPNLIINTNDVNANHGVSVGSLNEQELFYLMSKGINKFNAKKIIEEGFILSIMDDEIKDNIKNILMGR